MESYTLNEREHYEDVLGGSFLMELVHMMKLQIPEIKVTKRKPGFWGVRTKNFGRKEDPKPEDINYGTLTHDCDMGMNTTVCDSITCLSYRHRVELGTHYFGRLGWKNPEGAHIMLTDEQKVKFSPVLVYNQELGNYIKNLQKDLLSEFFENDALREGLNTEKQKVVNVQKHDLEIQKLPEDFKNSQTMAHAGDVEIQKIKNQLLKLQGRHRKLHINMEYLVEELEKTKPDQKKATYDEDMI
ncbi:hypothetical protein D1007_17120 [Hordeum vulgare]|uniref:Uncharacterized protein n=1 Tax=Hordeum vulgare subsp. vulgare TaxID=112509 RepID=A0A8I7B759_HORVV|nr:hypothetical protein D1007_17120 [Hordeum vulgare]